MKRLTKTEVKGLLSVDTPPCVSIYIPLEQVDLEGNLAVVHRRLLSIAQDLLLKSYSPSVAERMIEPLRAFSLRDFSDVSSGTLVLFKSPTVEGYVLVPKSLAGMAVVSDSFHLKPLLEFLIPYEEFYLLSLGREKAKLFRGDALSFEVHREFCLSDETFETLVEKPVSRGGVWGAVNRLLMRVGFSGPRTDRARFYSQLDKHVVAMLQGTRAPLLLAGKRKDAALYRSVNSYQAMARPSLPWEVQDNDIVELEATHEAATTIASRYYRHSHKEVLRELKMASRAHRVRLDVEEVVNALALNRVRILFFRKGEMSWGTVNWNTGLVRRSPYQRDGRDDDLIDDCIEKAVSQGCRIVALERYDLPECGPIAAILKPEQSAEELRTSNTVVRVTPRRFEVEAML